ncbi:hypothetical protein BRADI_4g09948v3 [Brachypodium distachyon]|uniref:Uncharacterized protein n=1 Tax=Brachypodium distachyon TaxID=15368 RepID=A0A0Q3EHP0_BRADI|nr:hypothetical protein BRADI_4g09948v3 [Brachypodium distachyon]
MVTYIQCSFRLALLAWASIAGAVVICAAGNYTPAWLVCGSKKLSSSSHCCWNSTFSTYISSDASEKLLKVVLLAGAGDGKLSKELNDD